MNYLLKSVFVFYRADRPNVNNEIHINEVAEGFEMLAASEGGGTRG